MLNRARNWLGRRRAPRACGLLSPRPLVVLQSDDWGRVGVRDREGRDELQASGIKLGQQPYDFYTLETAEDVIALRDLLQRHHDSSGRSPCVVMNFVMANLDFAKINAPAQALPKGQLPLLPLTEGLPGKWSRPGLYEAYRQGIHDGVFYPALHGLTHFCKSTVEDEFSRNGERAACLRTFWQAETPYIHWRMPWVGFEYARPGPAREKFLAAKLQTAVIGQAAKIFAEFFSHAPASACAPGYRANGDTRTAWSAFGVRVAQNGVGVSPQPPHMEECGVLSLHRTIDFEPSQGELPVEQYLRAAENSFARGVPAVISVHSINFHSTLKDFRTPTLRALDTFLSALESRYPDMLYVHDGDLYNILTQGKFASERGTISVTVTRPNDATPRSAGAN